MIFAIACEDGTAPDERSLPASPSIQVELAGAPSVVGPSEFWTNGSVTVRVPATDSTAHLQWRPTVISIEIVGKGSFRDLLVPYSCLEPAEPGDAFPFTFTWRGCDEVIAVTERVLSSRELVEIQQRLGGATTLTAQPLTTAEGAFYRFRVAAGKEAVVEAISRLETEPLVEVADFSMAAPMCFVADIVPPVACPPWYLLRTYPVNNVGGMSLEPSDTLRLTYVESDGDTIRSVHTFD